MRVGLIEGILRVNTQFALWAFESVRVNTKDLVPACERAPGIRRTGS